MLRSIIGRHAALRLATIPESKSLAKPEASRAGGLPPQEAEAFRMLRANLRYFNPDQDVRSVLVTSAGQGDGKSTVAWQLAVAAAAPGSKVLLIEADLRKPTLGEGLGVSGESRQGLSSVLAGQVELSSVVEEVRVDAHAVPSDEVGTGTWVPALKPAAWVSRAPTGISSLAAGPEGSHGDRRQVHHRP